MKKLILICLVALFGSAFTACNSQSQVNKDGNEVKIPILITEVDSVKVYYVIHNGRVVYFGVSKNGYVSISTQ